MVAPAQNIPKLILKMRRISRQVWLLMLAGFVPRLTPSVV